MHFLENSMFVLNAYFCRELRFVAILCSKLRFLFRNTGVNSDFTQNFWGKNWRLKSLVHGAVGRLEKLVDCLKMQYILHFIKIWPGSRNDLRGIVVQSVLHTVGPSLEEWTEDYGKLNTDFNHSPLPKNSLHRDSSYSNGIETWYKD